MLKAVIVLVGIYSRNYSNKNVKGATNFNNKNKRGCKRRRQKKIFLIWEYHDRQWQSIKEISKRSILNFLPTLQTLYIHIN